MIVDACSLGRVRLCVPEIYVSAVTLLVVTDHEAPQQIVKRFVFERILRSGDAERNVVGARKGPRVTNPAWQEGHNCRSEVVGGQGRTITKCDFHFRWS